MFSTNFVLTTTRFKCIALLMFIFQRT